MTKVVRLGLAASLFTILCATLLPSSAAESGQFLRCIVCGERGVADVILNVMLFLPLGGFLALAGMRWWRLGLGAALLSGSIECAQLFIPGRDSSVADVVSNTTGALVGCGAALALARSVRRPRRPHLLQGLVAVGTMVTVVAVTGYLVRPDFPASLYFGQWTPDLGHLQFYHGQVLQAWLGGVALPSQGLGDSRRVRELLIGRAPLHVRALAGPRVSSIASLFSIADEDAREIVLLGPDRDDLVCRYRTRAAAWRLDRPFFRVAGALRDVAPGDSLDIVVRGNGSSYCLALNRATWCGLGFTAGTGWAFLMYPEKLAPWVVGLLSAGWLVGILLPAGYWARDWATLCLLALIAAAGLAWLAPAIGLITTPLHEWIGAAVGLTVGWRLRRAHSNPRSAVA